MVVVVVGGVAVAVEQQLGAGSVLGIGVVAVVDAADGVVVVGGGVAVATVADGIDDGRSASECVLYVCSVYIEVMSR